MIILINIEKRNDHIYNKIIISLKKKIGKEDTKHMESTLTLTWNINKKSLKLTSLRLFNVLRLGLRSTSLKSSLMSFSICGILKRQLIKN